MSRTIKLSIEGMTCDHCTRTVKKALEAVPGVASASVDLASNSAEATLSGDQIEADLLVNAVVDAGYQARINVPSEKSEDRGPKPDQLVSIEPLGAKPQIKSDPSASHNQNSRATEVNSQAAEEEAWDLNIGGMHCASCVTRVEKALAQAPGVREARVNLATESARVIVDPTRARESALASAAAAAGYSAKKATSDAEAAAAEMRDLRAEEVGFWKQRLVLGIALTLPLVVLAYAPMAFPHAMGQIGWIGWLMLPAATILQAFIGGPYVRSAWSLAVRGSSNMDTLIALGTTAAYAYSLAFLASEAGATGGYSVAIALVGTALVDAAGAVLFGGSKQHAMMSHQH